MKTRFITHQLPVILWVVIIFTFSSIPAIKTSDFHALDFIVKKTAHIAEYAVLFILLTRAYSKLNPGSIFLVCLSLAFFDEIHQLYTPGRTGRIRDVLIFDTIGIFLGSRLIHQTKVKIYLK